VAEGAAREGMGSLRVWTAVTKLALDAVYGQAAALPHRLAYLRFKHFIRPKRCFRVKGSAHCFRVRVKESGRWVRTYCEGSILNVNLDATHESLCAFKEHNCKFEHGLYVSSSAESRDLK
jgi:hypothetical protein